MNFTVTDWRERRNILNNHNISFVPMQFTIANYSTEVRKDKKSDLETFDEDLLKKISNIPDPLKKNLADAVMTSIDNKEARKMPPKVEKVPDIQYNQLPEDKSAPVNHRNDFYPSITGITSFFTSFFGAISDAMFHRRPKSPVSQYYDCYDSDSDMAHEMAPDTWPKANIGDQNKKRAPDSPSTDANDNMNNCRAAAAHCEGKLNVVKTLLKTKTVPTAPKLRPRRPKRAFVEPGSVDDSYEDDFASDQYTSLANDEYIEFFARPNNQNQVFSEIDAAKMKIELLTVPENTEIVSVLPPVEKEPVKPIPAEKEIQREVISSCEDKMAKLQLLLKGNSQKNKLNHSTDSTTEPVKEERLNKPSKVILIDKKQDKKFKNPNRLTEKRNKTKMKKSIQDDMIFANEINQDEISTPENSPATMPHLQRVAETVEIGSVESVDYFDELKGRFHSASTTDSEDSFQIVFSDNPRPTRMSYPSECDSEDSFIVFEDSPDSCYTSNDVFNDSADESDAESDLSDSGCAFDVCKLSHTFSRTVSDLTDDSLYEDVTQPVRDHTAESNSEIPSAGTAESENNVCGSDELDCAVRTFEEVPSEETGATRRPGVLLDETKKQLRKDRPAKKVSFSEKPPEVRVMRVWAFAARQARAGHWERYGLDRERFKRRIADVDMAVSWVLKPQHRSRVMFQRFMPWWNQQRRKDAAEKKQKAEEEKRRLDEEKKVREERERIEEQREKEREMVEGGEQNIEGTEQAIEIEQQNIEGTKKITGEKQQIIEEEKKRIEEAGKRNGIEVN